MNYIVLCRCDWDERPLQDRFIVGWINDYRPAQKHVRLIPATGSAMRRGSRSAAGSGWRYVMKCPNCGKRAGKELAESTATAIIDQLKTQAAQMDTVEAPRPPDIGGSFAMPSMEGVELRRVIDFEMVLLPAIHMIGSRPGKK